jgi:hypothetical protein
MRDQTITNLQVLYKWPVHVFKARFLCSANCSKYLHFPGTPDCGGRDTERLAGILIGMPEPPSTGNYRRYPKGPSFGLVVVLAGVVLIIIFIVAYFFVMGHGSRMLPRAHPRKAEPTSRLVRPADPGNAVKVTEFRA